MNITEPPVLSVADQIRTRLEKRELSLVCPGVVAVLSAPAPGVGSVDHVFVHEVDLAILPCPAGARAVEDGVGQQDTVAEDVIRSKVRLDRGQSIGQAALLHLAAEVGAGRDVGVIHDAVVKSFVREDQHVVGGQLCVSAVETIVSMSRPVLPAVNRPVASDADLVEPARSNVSGLLICEAGTKIMLEGHGVGAGRSVRFEGFDQALDRLNAEGVFFGFAEDLIDRSDQAVLVLRFECGQISADESLQG